MSFWGVLALGLNTIVGSGIFRLPAEMAHALGPASIVVFVACALALSLVALAYAEAASLFDSDGGTYLYAREAFGEPVGFLVGWTVWLATLLTWATVAAAIGGQLHLSEKLCASVTTVALGAVNLKGVKPAAWVSTLLAAAKLVPLIAFVVIGAFFVKAENFAPFAPVGFAELPSTIVIAFFALSGFETAALPGASGRFVPLAIVASLVGAAILYALIQLVALGVDPQIASSTAPLADASRVFLGDASAGIFAAAGALSMFGLCTAMALAAPMVLRAVIDMSERKAVLLSTAITLLLIVVYDFRGLLGFTSVTLILQYLATCIAVPLLRRKYPTRARLVRLPLMLIALSCAGLCYLLALCQPSELIGAAVVLALGLLIFAVRKVQRA